MATPPRKLIFDDLITSLSGISVAAGYRMTVARVDRYLLGWDEVPLTTTPWIGCALLGQERLAYKPGLVDVVLPFTVAAVQSSTTDDTEAWRDEQAANMLDDIRHALMGDGVALTRSGNAVATKITQQWADVGMPVRDVREHGANIAAVVVLGECRYFVTPSRS